MVFSDAMVEHDGKFYVYYGAADNHIALATIEKRKFSGGSDRRDSFRVGY